MAGSWSGAHLQAPLKPWRPPCRLAAGHPPPRTATPRRLCVRAGASLPMHSRIMPYAQPPHPAACTSRRAPPRPAARPAPAGGWPWWAWWWRSAARLSSSRAPPLTPRRPCWVREQPGRARQPRRGHQPKNPRQTRRGHQPKRVRHPRKSTPPQNSSVSPLPSAVARGWWSFRSRGCHVRSIA